MIQFVPLNPWEQLKAGQLARRLTQLAVGLMLFGVSVGMMVRSGLGLDPWGVFHYGVADKVPLTFGQVAIVVSLLVLLLWVPLRQWPGLGTIANGIVIGLVADITLGLLTQPDDLWLRVLLLVSGVFLNGLGSALYIGAQLGPGPRDGLMTGLVRVTGLSVRLVRTTLELTVLAAGFLLGGTVGVGTVLFAVSIGPIVQLLLPRVLVRLDVSQPAEPAV